MANHPIPLVMEQASGNRETTALRYDFLQGGLLAVAKSGLKETALRRLESRLDGGTRLVEKVLEQLFQLTLIIARS